MKKCLIIIPYFGKLPTWFQLFINSCESKYLDFILFTDDISEYCCVDNFNIIHIDFSNFKYYFKNKFNKKIYLENPYKLCDYKPLYGSVFSEYTDGYEYWGYSDIDLIFGDIDYYLKPYFDEGFDKLFRYGHFSIYKNSEVMNSIFNDRSIKYNFDFIRNTTIPCHFDEIAINQIIKKIREFTLRINLFIM